MLSAWLARYGLGLPPPLGKREVRPTILGPFSAAKGTSCDCVVFSCIAMTHTLFRHSCIKWNGFGLLTCGCCWWRRQSRPETSDQVRAKSGEPRAPQSSRAVVLNLPTSRLPISLALSTTRNLRAWTTSTLELEKFLQLLKVLFRQYLPPSSTRFILSKYVATSIYVLGEGIYCPSYK